MRALLAVAIALGVMVSTGWAAGLAKPVKYAPPKVAFDASTGTATAQGGYYKIGSKKLKLNYLYQYDLADQGGNACGSVAPTTGASFKLRFNPYQLKARFGFKPAGIKRLIWGKWRTVEVGGTNMRCQQLTASTTLPPAPQLCSWTDGLQPLGSTGGCGEPPQNACAWTGPATLNNGEVAMGSSACPVSPCGLASIGTRSVTWFTPTPISIASIMTCGDLAHLGYSTEVTGPGQAASVGLTLLQFGHYDANQRWVTDCQAGSSQFHGIGVTAFTVPDNLGGVLRVAFVMQPMVPRSGGGLTASGQYEYETSEFVLHGSQSACPLNLTPINP